MQYVAMIYIYICHCIGRWKQLYFLPVSVGYIEGKEKKIKEVGDGGRRTTKP